MQNWYEDQAKDIQVHKGRINCVLQDRDNTQSAVYSLKALLIHAKTNTNHFQKQVLAWFKIWKIFFGVVATSSPAVFSSWLCSRLTNCTTGNTV